MQTSLPYYSEHYFHDTPVTVYVWPHGVNGLHVFNIIYGSNF